MILLSSPFPGESGGEEPQIKRNLSNLIDEDNQCRKMYGMVSTDQGKTRKVQSQSSQQPQRPPFHSQSSGEGTQLKERHNRSRPPKSIPARFWDFMKHAWTGVKFALGKLFFGP